MKRNLDIWIGENKWISWIDFDSTSGVLDIDYLLDPTVEFWNKLETVCMADCCGINAFTFDENEIKIAAAPLDNSELIINLLHAKEEIMKSTQDTVVSSRLNNLFNKSVFVQLLDHVLTSIEKQDRNK